VLAGNAHLAEYALRHNPRVSVVPTTIDTDAYVPAAAPPDQDGPPALGWTGSHSTVQHLDLLAPTLRALRRQLAYRLHVLGTSDYRLDGVEVRARAWSAATEVEDIRRFDVGLMPLPDDDWSRGKCGLKMLQCMALGIATVASPVGVNAEIVDDGANGLLASGAAEWLDRLTRLARDPDLRRRLGDNGRATVEERYSARVWAPRVGELLRQAAGRRAPARARGA
jgi:glycosyltransferase involved in cell wall biosynthesis